MGLAGKSVLAIGHWTVRDCTGCPKNLLKILYYMRIFTGIDVYVYLLSHVVG